MGSMQASSILIKKALAYNFVGSVVLNLAGLAARKAESKKVDKHAKACAENQHVFIPFAFDTFGSLAPEAINFLTRVQRVIHSNCSTPRGQGFVFGRLGFTIQKGLVAQLVARLPSVLM
ncbi:hypothetical protein Hanom_Chr07g00643951 [Helianthus anomalus]